MYTLNVGITLLKQKNNLNIIRLFAAFLVIYGHAYPLSNGSKTHDVFLYFSHGQTYAGDIGVLIFFILSGFLITMSYKNTNNFLLFLRSRILRIFPALIVIVLLTTFILGPLLTNLPLSQYFKSSSTYSYLLNILLYKNTYLLPGVFDTNIYGFPVNGSIWTLRYEFTCYLIVALLGISKCLNKKVVVSLFLISFALILQKDIIPSNLLNYIQFFNYFSFGMLIYLFRDKIELSHTLAFISFIILLATGYSSGYNTIGFIFVGYLTFYIGYSRYFNFHRMTDKLGDISYGVYITAWPIQQLVTHFFGGHMNPLLNIIVSSPFILIFSYASWHLIEKRALKLKTKKSLKLSKPKALIVESR